MREAKAFLDTKEIQQEIDKLQKRIDQQEAAQSTTQAIQTVLADGNPEDATRLATAGLQQFGGGDNAYQLAKLKREADALNIASNNDPEEHRKQLLRRPRLRWTTRICVPPPSPMRKRCRSRTMPTCARNSTICTPHSPNTTTTCAVPSISARIRPTS